MLVMQRTVWVIAVVMGLAETVQPSAAVAAAVVAAAAAVLVVA